MKLLQSIITPHLESLLSNKGVDKKRWESMLQPSRESTQGDLTLPCFPFTSILKMAPTAIADELEAFEGVAYAVPSSRLREGSLPDNALTRAVLNNYHPDRSGDIYLVFQPEWFINDMDGLSVTVTHGSPWRYDTFVPIMFGGYGLLPQKVARRVHSVDVALTLSLVAGTRPPSGAAGDILDEVLAR